MLDQLTRFARRATGLHGDAVGNAATSMRANRRAREHRETVELEVREVVAADRRTPAGAGRRS
jgi:hypothetical protein